MPNDKLENSGLPTTHSLSAEIQKEITLKTRARNAFLGFGCNRSETIPHRFIQERVWQDLCDENIIVSEQRNYKNHAFGASQAEALKKVQEKLGGAFQVTIPGSTASNSIDSSMIAEGTRNQSKLVCSFVHFDTARCTLRDYPRREDIKERGDALICSGVLYTGYQVHIEIEMEKQQNNQINTASTGSHISATDLTVLAKFGITKENFEQKLKGQQIASVSISSEGIGGYNPKTIDATKIITQFVDLSPAIKELESIENHFNASLSALNQRDYVVNRRDDIIEYDDLPQRPAQQLPEEIIEDMLENRKMKTLDALGEKIKKELSTDETKYLDDISLPLLFAQIEKILGKTLQEYKKLIHKKQVIVLGRSGAGKSTVLGYVLNYQLAPKDLSDGSTVLDYLEENDHVDRPKIGHSGAETKGCVLYTRDFYDVSFMDCAGTLDSEGPETDICNAMALSMMIKKKAPDAIMLTIPSSLILDNGRTGFLEIVEQLGKMLPVNEKTWSSIFLVINDKTPMLNPRTRRLFSTEEAKNHILANIQRNINILEEEREKLLPSTKGFSFKKAFGLKKGSLSEEERNELSLLSPDKVERIDRYSSNINKLRLLLNRPDNIILTDLLDEGKTREALFKVIDDREPLFDENDTLIHSPRMSLSGETFTPEFLYSEKVSDLRLKFEIVLGFIAAYFNGLMDKQQNSVEKIRRLKIKLSELTNENPVVGRTNAVEVQWDARIKKETDQQTKLQNEQIALENQITSLKQDITASALPPISSTKTIEPRSFFAVFGGAKYLFEHNTKIPYLSVEEKKPDSGGEFFPEQVNNPEAGIYKSYYRPAWHNYEDSSKARIIVSVQKKDDPRTATAIQELKEKYRALGEKLDELKINIKGLEARKTMETAGTARDAEEERKRQLRETKKALKKEELECRERILEMRAYSIFCQEVGQIISALELDTKSSQKEQRERFNKFLKYIHYSKPSFSSGDEFGDSPSDDDKDKSGVLNEHSTTALAAQILISTPFFFKDFKKRAAETGAKKTSMHRSDTSVVSPVVLYKSNIRNTLHPFFNPKMVSGAPRLKLGGILALTSSIVGGYFYNRLNNVLKHEVTPNTLPENNKIKL